MPYPAGRYTLTLPGYDYYAETNTYVHPHTDGPFDVTEDQIAICGGMVEAAPDPLPTTPGSVVTKNSRMYGLTADGDSRPWADLSGGDGWRFISTAELVGATVLFDAGAERA